MDDEMRFGPKERPGDEREYEDREQGPSELFDGNRAMNEPETNVLAWKVPDGEFAPEPHPQNGKVKESTATRPWQQSQRFAEARL
jgi:hypothetical protein